MEKKSLAQTHPEIAAQWHPTKNGDLSPDKVTPGSGQLVWWICPNDPNHEWRTRVNTRVNGHGCRYCAGKKRFDRPLSITHPEIALEWHPTKNKDLTPEKITAGSSTEVWWKCKNGHEWSAKISSRASKRAIEKGYGQCPYCQGKLPLTSFGAKYPELAKQWHPTKNGSKTAFDVFANSKDLVWWQCETYPEHEWQAQIKSRVDSTGECKFCIRARNPKKPFLAEFSPELAKEWHPTKNGTLTPDKVKAGSSQKAWWICSKNPSHEWDAAISNRTRGKGCPYCNKQKAGERNIVNLYPEIVAEWHPTKNGNLDPKTLPPGSKKRPWWQCLNDPTHEWRAYVFHRTKGMGKCPECAKGGKKWFGDVYPEIAKEWHPTKNGELTPFNVTPTSAQKIWWQCSNNPEHEWVATPQNRGANKSGCPSCYRERAGQELDEYLAESVKGNTEFYRNFVLGLQSINKMTEIEIKNSHMRQTLLRLLYANTITVMETYLSDAFINTVIRNPLLVRKFVETTEHFKEQQTNVSNVYKWLDRINDDVAKYLNAFTYHNIPKVQKMYNSVLDIQFPADLDTIIKAVMTRHDIVHRNGKTKDGNAIKLTGGEVKNISKCVQDFVDHIELQINEKFPS